MYGGAAPACAEAPDPMAGPAPDNPVAAPARWRHPAPFTPISVLHRSLGAADLKPFNHNLIGRGKSEADWRRRRQRNASVGPHGVDTARTDSLSRRFPSCPV